MRRARQISLVLMAGGILLTAEGCKKQCSDEVVPSDECKQEQQSSGGAHDGGAYVSGGGGSKPSTVTESDPSVGRSGFGEAGHAAGAAGE